MRMILIALAYVTLAPQVFCQTNPPAAQSTNAEAEAKQKGEDRAKADIAKGTMQILYYGKPWSMGRPLVDEETQLPVKIVAGCCVMPDFVAETDAYNAVMREAAKERKQKESANKASHGTALPRRP